MSLGRFHCDTRGSTAIEFGITAPLFFALVVGIIEFGLLMWTQVGLQHGAAMAARCASVSVNDLNDSSPKPNRFCGNGTVSEIQRYAASQTFGINPPASTFTVNLSAYCDNGALVKGNQVSASYSFRFIASYFGAPSITLGAQSCFPK